MKWPIAVLSLAGLLACRAEVALRGDCRGLVAGAECSDTRCVATTEVLEAQDLDGCEFLTWEGPCATERSCRASQARAVEFTRAAWRLTVDHAGIGPVVLQPGDLDCATGCERLLPVGTAATLRAPGAVFEGDCDSIAGDACLFTSDRARHVRVISDLVRLTVTALGPGRVLMGDDTVGCTACVRLVPRGSELRLQALAEPEALFMGWSNASCTATDCRLIVTEDLSLDALFAPGARLSVSIVGDGAVEVDGQRFSSSFELLRPLGEVTLRVLPGSSSVTAGFEGLACHTPRAIDECRFSFQEDTTALVKLVQFWRWVVPLPGSMVTDTHRVDGGVLALVRSTRLPLQSEVVEVFPPGAGRRSTSAIGLSTQNFLELPDGGLWLSGLLNHQPAPVSQQLVVWGAVDAGSSGRFRQDLALLRFDVVAFAPIEASIWDFPETGSARTALGPGPVIVNEGALLSSLSSQAGLDGGLAFVAGIVSTSADFSPLGFEAFPAAEPLDLSLTAAGPVALALSDTNTPVSPLCAANLDGVPTLTRVSGFSCGARGSAPVLDAGTYRGTSPLLRAADFNPMYASVSEQDLHLQGPLSRIGTNFGHVHAHDAQLGPVWLSTLRPLLAKPENSSLVPLGLVRWRDQVVAFFHGGSSVPGVVAGYQSENGLQILCPPNATAWTLIVSLDPAGGAVTWGHCALGDTVDGLPIVRGDLRRRPALGYNQQPRPLLIDDGILFGGGWISPLTPTTVQFGASAVTFTTPSSYLLAVTPP